MAKATGCTATKKKKLNAIGDWGKQGMVVWTCEDNDGNYYDRKLIRCLFNLELKF